jgi:hypothetical protein
VTSTTKLILEAESIDGNPLKNGRNKEARALINAAFSDYWKDMEGRLIFFVKNLAIFNKTLAI